MLIGVVSKPEHCKPHLKALRKMGHRAVCLGGRGVTIPANMDVVVLRTQSCSHGASDQAFAWSREGKKSRLVVENGSTTICRKVQEIEMGTIAAKESLTEGDARKAWGLLGSTRPKDTLEQKQKVLSEMGFDRKIVSIVSGMIPETPTKEQPAKEPMEKEMGGPIHSYPKSRGPFPTGKNWTATHTQTRLKNAWLFASKFASSLSKDDKREFLEAYEELESCYLSNGQPVHLSSLLQGRGVLRKFAGVFNGKPREYTAFLFLMKGSKWVSVKRPIGEGYKSLTGKACDSRLPDALSWFCGNPPPKSVTADWGRMGAPRAKVISKNENPGVEGVESPTASAAALESNTNAILEVMEDLSTHKREVKVDYDTLRATVQSQSGSITALESKLEEAIKAGFDPRTNLKLAKMEKRIGDLMRVEVQNFKHEVNRTLEPRVKALEGGVRQTNAPAQTPDLSSNPFAALEQVKAALKAAGFKGTLTLTIE